MSKRKLKWWAVILAPIVGLVLAEVLLRAFEAHSEGSPPAPFQISMTTHDGRPVSPQEGGLQLVPAPYTIWLNRPNHETVSFRINSRGLRGPEVAASRPDRERIIMVGGSAVFGWLIDRDEDTVPGQLQSLSPGTEVLNAGVVMFQSGQELSYFVTELVDFAPKVLVAYNGWADAFEAVYGDDRGGAPPGYRMGVFLGIEGLLAKAGARESDVPELTRSVFRRSRVVGALSRAFGGPGAEGGRAAPADASRAPRNDLAPGVEGYVLNMVKLHDFCRARGIRFLVALQPELGQKTTRTADEETALDQAFGETAAYRTGFPERYALFRRSAMDKLRSARVAAIDVGEQAEIASSPAGLFVDAVHTNRAGNAITARIIRDALSKLE